MQDLVALLTQVWDEQEKIARESYYEGQRWLPEEEGVISAPDFDVVYMADRKVDARHIVKWQPSAVLARIAADRQILTLHREVGFSVFDQDGKLEQQERYCETCQRGDEDELVYPCQTVSLLALPYVDTPPQSGV